MATSRPLKTFASIVVVALTACPAFAEDTPMDGGRSPNGKYEVRIAHNADRDPFRLHDSRPGCRQREAAADAGREGGDLVVELHFTANERHSYTCEVVLHVNHAERSASSVELKKVGKPNETEG